MVGLRIGMIVSVAGATLLALARIVPADISTVAFNPAGTWTAEARQFAEAADLKDMDAVVSELVKSGLLKPE